MHKDIIKLDNSTLCYSCGDSVIEFGFGCGVNLFKKNCKNKERELGEPVIVCSCCQEEIGEEDNYFILTVDHFVWNKIADEVGKKIVACQQCEGSERSYYTYQMNQDTDGEAYEAPGGISVSEYLYDQRVPEELYSLICQYIMCPRCRHGRDGDISDNPGAGIFELDDEVYTWSEVDAFWGGVEYEFEDELFSEFAARYGIEIEINELDALRDLLSKNPMMAMRSETGEKIYQVLKMHKEQGHSALLTIKEGLLYRGRNRKKDSKKRFKSKEMWSPPLGSASHGRYNAIGIPVLYVADSLQAIPYEIHPAHDEVMDIGQFIIQRNLSIFNLGEFDRSFQGFFNEMNEESTNVKQAYLLTNFIGACCTEIGYHGLKYEGVHNKNNLKYVNYALFNLEADNHLYVERIMTYEPRFTIDLEHVPAPVRKKKKPQNTDPTYYF